MLRSQSVAMEMVGPVGGCKGGVCLALSGEGRRVITTTGNRKDLEGQDVTSAH